MSNAETKAMMATKTARNAIQRIEALEKMIPNLISATNNALTEFETKLTQLAEVTDALVQNVGEEAVNTVLVAGRKVRAAGREAAEIAQIAGALATGALKPAASVGEGSVLVLKQYGADGQPLEFSRVQASVAILVPPLRQEALGKSVGYKMKAPNGDNSFEIMEIYDVAPPAAEVPAQAAAPAAVPAEVPAPEAIPVPIPDAGAAPEAT